LLEDPLGKWDSLLSLGCSVGNKPDREESLVLVIDIIADYSLHLLGKNQKPPKALAIGGLYW
jgi:hypothetical protein